MSIEIAAAATAVNESANMINKVGGVFEKLKAALVAAPREALKESLAILGKIETSYESVVSSLRDFVDLDVNLPSARSKLENFMIGEGLAKTLNTASINCKDLERVRKDHLEKIIGYQDVEEVLRRLCSADNDVMYLVRQLIEDLREVSKAALDAYESGDSKGAKAAIEAARHGLRTSRQSAASALEQLRELIREFQAEAIRVG